MPTEGGATLPSRRRNALAYLSRQNFWERFRFNEEIVQEEKLRRFTTSTSFNDITDIEKTDTIAEDIADRVIKVLRSNHVRVKASYIGSIVWRTG